jgi:hypothetical protein
MIAKKEREKKKKGCQWGGEERERVCGRWEK